MIVRHFCTYFDHRYLARGVAMFRSLRRHCPEARLWVLCLSDECHRLLERMAVPGLNPIRLEDFERGDEALLAAKRNRSVVEYYFTCSPSLPLFVLRAQPDIDCITYLDSDLYFYSSVEPLFRELGDGAVSIIPHRYPADFADPGNGTYNVAWLTFRNDARGRAVLAWWRERCLEWCYDRVEDGKFADQGYLNDWPQRFPGVVVLQNKGANLAPWNVGNYAVHLRDGRVFADDDEVVFFHFHRLKRIRPWWFHIYLWTAPTTTILRSIYQPYILAWRAEERVGPSAPSGGGRRPAATTAAARWSRRFAAWRDGVRDFARGRYVLVLGRRIWRLPFFV